MKEQELASKKIRLETRHQKRLVEKASKLSNEDLLEIFRQRGESNKVQKSKGKDGKGKKEKAKQPA